MAREVGTEGTLGGQAQVTGVGGRWKDLTDNVNSMAANYGPGTRHCQGGDRRGQRRSQAAARRVERGEIATLADTINWMTETLATFADQVTNVAREVGIDGKLGGRPGCRGRPGSGATSPAT